MLAGSTERHRVVIPRSCRRVDFRSRERPRWLAEAAPLMNPAGKVRFCRNGQALEPG
jgi:hypothetical protein